MTPHRPPRRSPRRRRTPSTPSRSDAGEGDPSTHGAAHPLVLVQDRVVVCVVEGHRREAVCSVARLICRLGARESCVYACPPADAAGLRENRTLAEIPGSWSELYRAVPLADSVIGVH